MGTDDCIFIKEACVPGVKDITRMANRMLLPYTLAVCALTVGNLVYMDKRLAVYVMPGTAAFAVLLIRALQQNKNTIDAEQMLSPAPTSTSPLVLRRGCVPIPG